MRSGLMFLLFFLTFGAGARTIILPKNHDGGLYKPEHKALPGDTILLEGDYSYINIENINGNAAKPVIILNKGLVRVGRGTNNYSFLIVSSHFVHVDGSGSKENRYGFQVGGEPGTFNAQSFTFFACDNFQVNNIEIWNAQVGFFNIPYSGGPFKNISIHNNYIHDLGNPGEQGRSEGVYIGNTEQAYYKKGPYFDNIEIFNNIFDNLSGDGIQVARCTNLKIHDNRISNYGKANLKDQNTGIIIGGCSTAIVTGNKLKNGTGTGIQVFGAGENIVSYNTLINTSRSKNSDGIYISRRCSDGPPLKVRVIGNKIDKAARNFIMDGDDAGYIIEEKDNSLGRKLM